MEPITYGPAVHVPGTNSVRRCRVYRGPHYVADVDHAGPNYFVMGLYYGSPIRKATDRDTMIRMVQEQAQNTPLNPRDCDPFVCEHR